MTNPGFSEFTYGYSLIHDFCVNPRWKIRGAPLFPNLRQEGYLQGGYDAAMKMQGIMVLFQFKIPQVMVRKSKHMPGQLSPVYYRMHFHRSKLHGYRQHESLIRHERNGRLVRYCTPTFHTQIDMDRFFSRNLVHSRSLFLKPDSIGNLSDEDHHIAYKDEYSPVYLMSDPKIIQGSCFGSDSLMTDLEREIGLHDSTQRVENELYRLLHQIETIDSEMDGPSVLLHSSEETNVDEFRSLSLIDRVSIVSQLVLGTIPIIFTK